MRKLFFFAILIVLASCQKEPQEKTITVSNVSVTGGLIAGKLSDDQSIKIFKGIPFAAPPVGDLRWKAPQPVIPWEGVLDAKDNPASFTQNPPVPFFAWSEEFLIPKEPISEDGLYLNVWTPAQKTAESLPVMVWIHGGGFSAGSGTVPLYDGEALAKKGIVVVTINYRLGIFGFLAHPELSQENPDGVSGNYGILDQIAALEWVKNNIKAFGGDPSNVTIAGQSAGAFSVNALVVSPKAKGLFHKAIAESGGMVSRGSGLVSGLRSAEIRNAEILAENGITSLESLRQISADSLLKISGRFSPVVDGVVIPPVKKAIETGQYSDVPLLTGWNADDMVGLGPEESPALFRKNAQKQYGGRAGEYLELFPANDEEQLLATRQLIAELFFGLQNYTWAKLQAEYGTHPSYLYYFTRIPPGEPNYGAFHSAEFAYTLHTLKYWNRPFEEVDYQLEETMSSYWVNFIKTGNPNGEGLPEWPQFDPENPLVIELGEEVKSTAVPHWRQLKFLES
ncbi:carboxylesterase family protein [Algoriphagus kandeliae]|uniref:Carboxylic ester hydrolase n=1 Tax=Algoriphagus kandeliae TaxID=2562278 RepID=A0A4Y9QK23_9BACT|nr:carboxylesterase family protein [Algoriphagus kandeliae]TFV93054.1 carboxylesterase family protein [Algoriphagus kandeliae]